MFTHAERIVQLTAFADLCEQMARLLAAHGDQYRSTLFSERATRARDLPAAPFTKQDLDEVGGQFPDGPAWIDARAETRKQPWQDEFAVLYREAQKQAMNMRAVAMLKDS